MTSSGWKSVCPRTLHLRNGALEHGVDHGGGYAVTDAPPRLRPSPTRRPSRPVVLLVPVPGSSTIHDLWAGTKLLVVFGVSVLLTFYPGWVTIGLVAALVLAALRIARIPRGALPSIPRWLWIVARAGLRRPPRWPAAVR